MSEVPDRFKYDHEDDADAPSHFRARIAMKFESQIVALQLQERRPSRDNMVKVLLEEALAARSEKKKAQLFKTQDRKVKRRPKP